MFDLTADYYAFDDVNHTVIDVLARLRRSLSDSPSLLDIGCGRGQLASAARHLTYRVTGIECHPDALEAAQDRVDELLSIDLADKKTVAAELGERKFDVILFACVLEHIPDPLSALRFYRGFLKPDGRIVVSLPNIACWDRRLALLFGRFDYADSGIMDRTHLRFFTFSTAQALLREAGLATLSAGHAPGVTRAFLPLIKRFFTKNADGAPDPRGILDSPAYRRYERWVLPAETWVTGLWRGLLSFRIVLVGAAREVS
ncbi:MAG TPA: class I SAM-dependent methyltransferase [Stellaceae bacterium]|nr:class I SAM-dependent methyltransferase [Stellaceae bacterium]